MTDRVDATVYPVQTPGPRAAGNPRAPEPERAQLGRSDNAVLTPGDPCNLLIKPGAFVAHRATKAPGARFRPLPRPRAWWPEGQSSLRIVPTAVVSVIFTRVGAVSFTLNVSSGSTAVSPLIGER